MGTALRDRRFSSLLAERCSFVRSFIHYHHVDSRCADPLGVELSPLMMRETENKLPAWVALRFFSLDAGVVIGDSPEPR
jgi:hypothetical protein